MHRYPTHALSILSVFVGLFVAAPTWAGTYAKVNQSDWQQGVTGLPTYVNMYLYLPTTLASKPPIVVYTHHCSGDAASSHSSQGGLEKIADTNGFIIIYPEATGENCWDAGSTRSLKHGGGGDTGAVVQQVKYVIGKYSGDANRVYAAGDSSGGIMTEALVGVYPDVFMAGISIMGVPCGCWAEGYNDVVGKPSNGTGQWSGPCSGGTVTKTAQQWGDLVRSYFPGYTGHRPRVQHWHGATDTTINYKNVAEDIKEWTNLLGLTEAPTGTEQNTPKSGTTHQFWKNSCFTVYETFVLANTGHAVSVDANTIAKYFGLDKAGGEDPETAACPGAIPGGGGGTGTGGAGGAGGATGMGGATGTGGSTSTGGATGSDGGQDGRDSGVRDVGTSGTGGAQGTGGATSEGGAPGTGGKTGTGGASGSGGGNGGSGSGGAPGTGGSNNSGGAAGSGGSLSSGGAVSGGAPGSGGAAGQGGSSTNGVSSTPGCSCSVGSHAGHSSTVAVLLLVALGLIFRRRRRARPDSL